MAVNPVPTLQSDPMGQGNLPMMLRALGHPQGQQQPGINPGIGNPKDPFGGAADDIAKAITNKNSSSSNPNAGMSNNPFSGFDPTSQGSWVNPNQAFPYGFNGNGAPTGTDPTFNPLGDGSAPALGGGGGGAGGIIGPEGADTIGLTGGGGGTGLTMLGGGGMLGMAAPEEGMGAGAALAFA